MARHITGRRRQAPGRRHAAASAGAGRRLATYRVHGAHATLFGVCGIKGEPSCHKRGIFLFLRWKRQHVLCEALSHNQRRHVLVDFARSLRPVR